MVINMSSKLFGIDFGTSVIKIYKKNSGVIYDSKNIIAVADSERIIAYGDEAFDMLGKTPSNIEITFPVRNGVIADIEHMTSLLNSVFAEIEKKHGKIAGSEFIVASPTDITEVEKRAFVDLVASSLRGGLQERGGAAPFQPGKACSRGEDARP